MRALAILSTLAVLGTALFAAVPFESKAATQDSELVASVSGVNLVQTIQHLQDYGSRAFYLDHSREAAAYIYDRFSELGLYVRNQSLMAGTHPVVNVIATLNGTQPGEPAFLVGAHYDCENVNATNYSLGLNLSAPGADDDGSGIAAVLELARILAPLHFNNTIMFVAFGAEEMGYDMSGGLAGSVSFVVDQFGKGQQFEATAIMDMIGYKSGTANNITFVLDAPGDPFEMAATQAITTYGLDLEPTTLVYPSFTYSDHAPFWWWDYPSMLVIEQLDPFNPFYHTENDTLSTLNVTLMTETTRALLGALLSMNAQVADVPEFPGFAMIALVAAVIPLTFYVVAKKRRSGG